MSSKNIGQFDAVSSAQDTDSVPLWRAANKRITIANLRTSLQPPTNTFSQVCYVSANGNNSTAVVGDSDFPFLTMQAAYIAAGSASGPRVFHLSAGTFAGIADDSSGVDIRVLGAGRDKTTITLVAGNLDAEYNGNVTIHDIGNRSCLFSQVGAQANDADGPTITLENVCASVVICSGGDSVGPTAKNAGNIILDGCYIGDILADGGTSTSVCGNGGTVIINSSRIVGTTSVVGGSNGGGVPGNGGSIVAFYTSFEDDMDVSGGYAGDPGINGNITFRHSRSQENMTFSAGQFGILDTLLSEVTTLTGSPTTTAVLSTINGTTY